MTKIGDIVRVEGLVEETVHLQGEDYNLRVHAERGEIWLHSSLVQVVSTTDLDERLTQDAVDAASLPTQTLEAEVIIPVEAEVIVPVETESEANPAMLANDEEPETKALTEPPSHRALLGAPETK